MPRNRKKLDVGRRSPSIYSRTEQIKESKSFKWFYYLVFALLVSLASYFVFFSSIFRIDEVSIVGTKYFNSQIIYDQVTDMRNNFIYNNLLTFHTKSLESKIEGESEIESVEVNKFFPHKLEINIVEKSPAIVWETLGKKYLVDKGGTIISDYDEKFTDTPVVIDSKNIPVQAGKQVVASDFCIFVNDLNDDFFNMTGVQITKFEVPEITEEIKVSTSSGYYVLFDTTRSASGELDNLIRVLNELKSSKRKLQYVDLRLDNKIFYK